MPEMPPYPENMILLVEVGSTAHGTGLAGGEDHDETAVVVEAPSQVLGLSREIRNHMQRTQPEGKRSGPGDIDRQIYSLRSFLALATKGNPSIMLALWAPVIQSEWLGRQLQSMASCFVGRHIIPRYRGYMQSQVMRMQGLKPSGHGKRGGGKREELIAEHGWDSKYGMHAARLGFQCLELLSTTRLTLPIQGEPGEWLRAVRRGEVPYEEWLKRVEELDATLEQWLDEGTVRAGPDREAIDQFSIDAHRTSWGWE